MKVKKTSYWLRSAFYTFLQRFSVTLFGMANFMILARSLTKLQMGIWALFLIVTTIFETTKSALLKNAHVKYVSSINKDIEKASIASSSFLINSFLSLLFISLIIFLGNTFSKLMNTGPELSMLLRWYIPGIFLMVFFSHLEAVQQSNLDFKGIFAGYFIRQLLFFCSVLIHFILKIPFTLQLLVIYQVISNLFGVIAIYIYSKKYLLFIFNPSTVWVKKVFGFGGYIFGSGIMSNIVSNVDQIMTATFLSASSVAYYNTATRINGIVDIPSFVASEILFPKSSQASAENDVQKVKYLYEKMVAILLSFTTPTALFIILFPKFIIQIIAGSSYIDAAPILQLYMLAGILRPMQNQAANLLNSIGKPGISFIINSFTLLLNIPINYLCFLYFGFYGAAIGTLITLSISTTVWYFTMKKRIDFEFSNILKYMRLFIIELLQKRKLIFNNPNH